MSRRTAGDNEKPKRIESPRLIWLETFIAVCAHQSYGAATSALGLSDSTLRDNIAFLEGWLGRTLFLKEPLRLTPEGKAFLPDAKKIVLLLYDHKRCDDSDLARVISEKFGKELSRKLVENKVTGESYYAID